ncbi:MAG: thiolase family protein, partial [Gammaproteobacteria bacterium]
MKKVLIADYVRSPFTPAHKGALGKVRPDELAAQVIRALLAKTAADPETVEDLILGCAFPEAEQGLNVARLIGFLADLPVSVTGVTVNRFCGSSMQAVHMAAGAIQMNAGEAFICAGVESMSRVPVMGFNPLPHPGLYRRYPQAYMSMGQTAENVARQYQVTRHEQEVFALTSQQKAAAAEHDGRFAEELVPIDCDGTHIERDGCIRADTTLEALASLKPAFDANGTVTAGTSSPLTDGAAAILVCTEKWAANHGREPLAQVKSIAAAGCPPELMGLGPVAATRKALARAKLSLADIDLVELNEAFASQSI